jgi:hypothetical protein
MSFSKRSQLGAQQGKVGRLGHRLSAAMLDTVHGRKGVPNEAPRVAANGNRYDGGTL